ncbi:MAG TPA: hypothetical protein VFX50_19190 [Gemmatimonadales bacterium]|nr:hypothetical protein [Gemmatimonadales bacterium]
MNRALRRRHGRVVTTLALVAAVLLAVAYLGRQPMPAMPLPALETPP